MEKTIKFKVPEMNNPSIIVEAGHIYTNEIPTVEQYEGAKQGTILSEILEFLGFQTAKWLFIDDYNPLFQDKPIQLDIPDYCNSLSKFGFAPDKIVYESDLVDHAEDILSYLQKNCYAGVHNNGKTILNKGKVLLYDPENEKCSLLDACLYLQKLEEADSCVTVLDKQYASQQKGTILKKLGIDITKIFPCYYTTPDSYTHASIEPSNVHASGNSFQSFASIDILQIAKFFNSESISPLELEAGYGA
ncbi:MAG: hypothetical protein ACLFP2_05165 [Candidatus Woesearchaeota archaeon]